MNKANPIILAVDDDVDSLSLINAALTDYGYTVLVASSGIQAIQILQKATPNLVLLDAIMPEMDGFQTCKSIKNIQPSLPVIFMTGLSETEKIVQGLTAGAVDYLVKPINHQELIARVEVHIRNAQLTDNTKAALDSTGQHMIAINSEGDVIWTTEQAQTLIENFSTKDREYLIHWLLNAQADDSLEIQQNNNTVIITYIQIQTDSSHLIRLKTQNFKLVTQTLKLKLKVTRREAEVLFWVSQGKTDWEIAQILSISERTVNKHLEQIYRKLNVNNRTAATRLALNNMN